MAVDIDRDRVLAQGVALESVYEALQGYFGQRYINDFNAFGRTWQVQMQAEADARDAADDLLNLKIRGAEGQLVPLSSFVSLRETAGPERTMHYNTFEAIDLNSGPASGVSGDEAKAAMEEILSQCAAARRGLPIHRPDLPADFGRQHRYADLPHLYHSGGPRVGRVL